MGEPHSTPPDLHLVLRDASVNLGTGEVTRGDGRTARLSSTELQLLMHLRSAGTSVRREVLLAEVFGYSRSTSSRTLDTTMGRLRKKIEVDTRKPDHLLTVQGVGYRFAPLAQEQDVGAPTGARSRRAHVPADAGRFIGREQELARALELLTRLATLELVGLPGVGRSRFSREVAARWVVQHGRPAWWVAAPEEPDPEEVRVRLLDALKVRGVTDDAGVRLALARRGPGLLVLDGDTGLVPLVREAGWSVITTEQVADASRLRIGRLGAESAMDLLRDRVQAFDASVGLEDSDLRTLAKRAGGLARALCWMAPRVAVLGPRAIQSPELGLESCWSTLESSTQQLLAAASWFVGPFIGADLRAVLDRDVVTDLATAERAGLVEVVRSPSDHHFTLIGPVRDLAAAVQPDPERFVTWAVQTSLVCADCIAGERSTAFGDRLERLASSLVCAWELATPDDAAAIAIALLVVAERRGTEHTLWSIQERTWRRAPSPDWRSRLALANHLTARKPTLWERRTTKALTVYTEAGWVEAAASRTVFQRDGTPDLSIDLDLLPPWPALSVIANRLKYYLVDIPIDEAAALLTMFPPEPCRLPDRVRGNAGLGAVMLGREQLAAQLLAPVKSPSHSPIRPYVYAIKGLAEVYCERQFDDFAGVLDAAEVECPASVLYVACWWAAVGALDQGQHDVFDRAMAACERALVGFGAPDGPRAMQGLNGLALVDRGETERARGSVESNEFLSADIVRVAAEPHPRWTAPRGSDDRVEGQIRAVFHGALTDDRAVLEPLATGQIAFFVRDAARRQLERLDGVPERAGGMLYARIARRIVVARG